MGSFESHQWHTHVINNRPHFTLLAHQETGGTRGLFFLIPVFTAVSFASDWAAGVIAGRRGGGRSGLYAAFLTVSYY